MVAKTRYAFTRKLVEEKDSMHHSTNLESARLLF